MLGNKLGRFFLGKRSVLRASAEQHTGDAAEGSSHAPDLEHMARQIEHLQRELSLARAQASATSSQQRQSHRSSGRSALAPRDLERAPPAGERSENSTAHGASRSYSAHPEEEPGQGISEGSASSLAPEILRLNRMLKRREEQQEEEDRRFRLMMSSIKTTLEGTLTETEARQREALKQRSHRGRKLSFSRDRQRSPSPVGVFTPLSANHGRGTSGAHETSPSNGRTADLSALSLKGTAQRDRARDGARDGEPCAYLRYSATDVEGRKCYAGQLKSGLRHGLGRLECVDGSTYTGDWLDDHPCGYGIETYSDGSAYTGSFRDDLRHGYGEFLTPSGACYSGQFEKGEMHGTVFIKEVDSRGAECEVSARADHGNIYREPDWDTLPDEDPRKSISTGTLKLQKALQGVVLESVNRARRTAQLANDLALEVAPATQVSPPMPGSDSETESGSQVLPKLAAMRGSPESAASKGKRPVKKSENQKTDGPLPQLPSARAANKDTGPRKVPAKPPSPGGQKNTASSTPRRKYVSKGNGAKQNGAAQKEASSAEATVSFTSAADVAPKREEDEAARHHAEEDQAERRRVEEENENRRREEEKIRSLVTTGDVALHEAHSRLEEGAIMEARAARNIVAKMYASVGDYSDWNVSTTAGRNDKLAALDQALAEAEAKLAASQLDGEIAKGAKAATVAEDATTAAKEALAEIHKNTEQLKEQRRVDEERLAYVAAASAAVTSAKEKLRAKEVVAARAAWQTAEQFFRKAGDVIWEEQRDSLQALGAAIAVEEDVQKTRREHQAQALLGDDALKLALEKLAAGDLVGANVASAAAAGFFDSAGVYGDERGAELAQVDALIVEAVAEKQKVLHESKLQRVAEEEARRNAVAQAEKEAEMWRTLAEEERRNFESARARAKAQAENEKLEKEKELAAAEARVTEEMRQAQRALMLLEDAKKEAQESLEFMKKEEQELKMKRMEEEEALRKQQEETLVAQERALAIEAELQKKMEVEEAKKKREEEEAEALQRKEEGLKKEREEEQAAVLKQKEKEAEKRRAEAEALALQRKEEEGLKKKKAEEEAAALMQKEKEAEKRRAEEEAEALQRQEEDGLKKKAEKEAAALKQNGDEVAKVDLSTSRLAKPKTATAPSTPLKVFLGSQEQARWGIPSKKESRQQREKREAEEKEEKAREEQQREMQRRRRAEEAVAATPKSKEEELLDQVRHAAQHRQVQRQSEPQPQSAPASADGSPRKPKLGRRAPSNPLATKSLRLPKKTPTKKGARSQERFVAAHDFDTRAPVSEKQAILAYDSISDQNCRIVLRNKRLLELTRPEAQPEFTHRVFAECQASGESHPLMKIFVASKGSAIGRQARENPRQTRVAEGRGVGRKAETWKDTVKRFVEPQSVVLDEASLVEQKGHIGDDAAVAGGEQGCAPSQDRQASLERDSLDQWAMKRYTRLFPEGGETPSRADADPSKIECQRMQTHDTNGADAEWEDTRFKNLDSLLLADPSEALDTLTGHVHKLWAELLIPDKEVAHIRKFNMSEPSTTNLAQLFYHATRLKDYRTQVRACCDIIYRREMQLLDLQSTVPHEDPQFSSKLTQFLKHSHEALCQVADLKNLYPGNDSKYCLLLDYVQKLREDVANVKTLAHGGGEQPSENNAALPDTPCVNRTASDFVRNEVKLAAQLELDTVQRDAERYVRLGSERDPRLPGGRAGGQR